MPLADYHLHTPLCGHAVGEPGEYVAAARARGLEEIGFSDHCPMPDLPGGAAFDDWRMRPDDLPRYLDMIGQARADAAPFPVRLGLECDFIAGREGWIEELATAADDWDYLIGSVHYLASGWDVDNPRHLSRFTASAGAVEEIWTLYWRAFAACARSRLFDFLAHPDLVKKFGHRPTGDLRRFYEPALLAVAESGVALELSTAGLHKPAGELYPSAEFLTLARAAGVPIVINSDAHAPAEVGRDFHIAVTAARAAGYTESLRFARRQRRFATLPGGT